MNPRINTIIMRLNVMILESRGIIDALDQGEVEILCFIEASSNAY